MHETEMGLQKMQNQEMGLILSTEAKPRLKWTPELHQRFVNAVTQLGGAEKATPKTLMRVMSIPGLTLYHLKSHLQKYRLGKNQLSESSNDNEQEDSTELDFKENNVLSEHVDEEEIMDGNHTQINESLHIAQALQMQMEVQKKLQEQIEVQRRLQLRIEAQGKYLQTILKKAQETLSAHCSSPVELEAAKDEASKLVSMVENQCPSPPLSGLTETSGFWLKSVGKRTMRGTNGSADSSFTSSESYGRKDEKQRKLDRGNTNTRVVLPLMEMNTNERNTGDEDTSFQVTGRKRSGSPVSDESCVEQPLNKSGSSSHQQKPASRLIKSGLAEKELDLNSKFQGETGSSGCQEFDLNRGEADPF